MKKKVLLAGLLILVILTSCKKDEDVKLPEIVLLELGHDNNKTGYIGHELHVDADITAPGRIDELRIIIKHKSSPAGSSGNEAPLFDSIYTEFNGLRNTHFHKDIEIPENAEEGEYIFRMSVTDQLGRNIFAEEELDIHHGEGHEH